MMMHSAILNQHLLAHPGPRPEEVERCFDRLWPLMRSISGDGVRRTHDILGEIAPLERLEVPTGAKCFDWTVPDEWVFESARLYAPDGELILDAAWNTLHVLNYSAGFCGELPLEELQKHLHSAPDMPDAVPYVTSYYKRQWGLCMSHRQREKLQDGLYRVEIKAEHIPGSMTISHCVLPGESEEEILFSTYTCHPSMANNELSGPLVAAYLLRRLAALPKRRYTYRFLFVPETIGSIAYLAQHGAHLRDKLRAGYVLSCIGDSAPATYKRSRQGKTRADRAAEYVLQGFPAGQRVLDYWPGGSDERQYCSPGFDLPVGVLARSIYGDYPEYHTSLDNKAFVSFEAMCDSVDLCFAVALLHESNQVFLRTEPHCEPFLSRYNLYDTQGAQRLPDAWKRARQWVLNLSDGQHDLLSMACRSGLDYWLLAEVAVELASAGLIFPSGIGMGNTQCAG
jgi:aminopeptidase-like protein